jgi:Subtilase family
MKGSSGLRFCISILALCVAGSALPETSATLQGQQLAQHNVIVIMRDQLASVPPMRRAMGARAAAIAEAQVPVLTQLQQSRPHKVRTFGMINAFATSLTPGEEAQLSAHPQVLAVVPDAVIHAQRRVAASNATPAAQSTAGSTAATATATAGLCGTLEPQALQLTNTAFLDVSTPQAQEVLDGNGQKVTGKGVKVAFIADGVDPTVAGFVRPDGSSVFIDYQDFSGDPAGTPTPGGEAFGDASSIAAQDMPSGTLLNFDISQFVNAAHPLPSPCDIHIRGMAPGASLVGLKVFSNLGLTTNSGFVQAIEYAVIHDDVDVINESFGGSPFPDTALDPTSLANAAAVAAGVTVVASTGDAGSAGTLGSPSTDPYVIAAGATTQYRLYAQTGEGAQALAKGVISNNISPLSSGGFSQLNARTVDVVAPGDLGWALCSTNPTLFTDCTNFKTTPGPTPIQAFGGTSESAPLTSGEAALIIQAYRSTHKGADPSPALIKRIIMSTATDLGAPSFEQGAGLINALAAVKVALSVVDEHGAPKAQGDAVLLNPSSADITGQPSAHESRAFSVTNTSSKTQHLTPSLETLGAPIGGATLTLSLDPATDPTFPNPNGAPRSYIEQKISVPAGAQHLDAAVSYPVPNPFTSPLAPIVYLGLLDPSGRQAAYSIPQGFDNGYGHVDIVNPTPGTWTVLIWTRPSGPTSYSGPVQLTWAAERYVTFGSVSPSHLDLAPGSTATITAQFEMPSQSGDLAAAIRFDDATQPEIPVSLRTLIPVGPLGGDFTGTLTGGNGRAEAGPTLTYEFNVPAGMSNMSLVLQISDSSYFLEGFLVDPQGMELSVQPNLDPFGNLTFALQLYRENPQPGPWRFVLLLNYFSSGNQTSLPFTGRIAFNTTQITASGLPNDPSTRLSASGAPVAVTVNVTNTTPVTEAYFADARLNELGVTALPMQPVQKGCTPATTLPATCGLVFLVPPEAASVQFASKASAPIMMDAFNTAGFNTESVGFTGSPDIFATRVTPENAVATLVVPEVPYGPWQAVPALVGPYGPAGALSATVATSAEALMQPFDAAVASNAGDIWADVTLGTNTFNPLVLAAGESGVINVTIKPEPTQVGKTVSGFLYIDTYNPNASTGDEVVRIPYRYTVVK